MCNICYFSRAKMVKRASVLSYMYTICLLYSSCIMFSVVFGEGWMLNTSEAFRPNFYKSADLNFSYFINAGGFFSSGHDSVLQIIRRPAVRSKLLLSSSGVDRSEFVQAPTFKHENPTQIPKNIKLTSRCLENSRLK